jgi:hypothetical protein
MISIPRYYHIQQPYYSWPDVWENIDFSRRAEQLRRGMLEKKIAPDRFRKCTAPIIRVCNTQQKSISHPLSARTCLPLWQDWFIYCSLFFPASYRIGHKERQAGREAATHVHDAWTTFPPSLLPFPTPLTKDWEGVWLTFFAYKSYTRAHTFDPPRRFQGCYCDRHFPVTLVFECLERMDKWTHIPHIHTSHIHIQKKVSKHFVWTTCT